MTLQDYVGLTRDSLLQFLNSAGPTLANFVAFAVIFSFGLIISFLAKNLWSEILKTISLEKNLSKWNVYLKLTKYHPEIDIENFFGELIRWLVLLIFIFPSISALGIAGTDQVLKSLLSYLPDVIIASLFLILGFVFAWFIHRAVTAVGFLLEKNPAHFVADVASSAIILFSSVQALLQLGLTREQVNFLILAFFAALALAFGLAGKEPASALIKKWLDKAKK